MQTFHRIVFTSVLFLSSFFSFAQNSSDIAKINFIKARFAEINNDLKSFKKVIVQDTAETTEGNEVIKYFNGNEIKKINATYYGETGKAIEEYYFFNKKIIFYYGVEYRYDVPIYVNNGHVKVVSIKETRYYFKDDNIFKVKLNPKHTISPTTYIRLSIETQKEGRRLMKL
jgi:hypothetical protein